MLDDNAPIPHHVDKYPHPESNRDLQRRDGFEPSASTNSSHGGMITVWEHRWGQECSHAVSIEHNDEYNDEDMTAYTYEDKRAHPRADRLSPAR